MLATRHHITRSGWTGLEAELDAWSAAGRRATFWWRDDDAIQPGPALDRLLDIASARPLAIAVIPARAERTLANRLADIAGVTVLQHGYDHANHAPGGEKKAEFGPHRPLRTMLEEARAGRDRLEALFGEQFDPVFVPPWNRIADDLPAALAAQGYRGLSSIGPRAVGSAPWRCNCHVDIIDWRGGRRFLGEEQTLARITGHLAMRRSGDADGSEPTGLLTHHRDHDHDCWQFLEALLPVIDGHRAAEWQSLTAAGTGSKA